MREGKVLKSMQKAGCPCRATADHKEQHQFRVVPTFECSHWMSFVKLRNSQCEQGSCQLLQLFHLPWH